MSRPPAPRVRVRILRDAPIRSERPFVLYLMTANRRLADNHALDHALHLGDTLGKPVVCVEALRAGHAHASPRLQRFVIDGMVDQLDAARGTELAYVPFVEKSPGEGRGLFEAFGRSAAAVVMDDSPAYFLPRMTEASARAMDALTVGVESSAIVPLALEPRTYPSAYALRRVLQRLLPPQLDQPPAAAPLRAGTAYAGGALRDVLARFPAATREELARPGFVASLRLPPGPEPTALRGGARAAHAALAAFVRDGLPNYLERHHPDDGVGSKLSPYLHFGHLSPSRVFAAVTEGLALRLVPNGGKREGFFGAPPHVEAFLDQLLVHRELAYRFAREVPEHPRFDALPAWAKATLDAHRGDPRAYVYDLATLEAARTHDPVWNSAQRELLETGTMHNYLRMLWGKLVITWSASPEEAFERLVYLNDRYALDGRDPNGHAGIAWCFGLFDRPFGPARPVLGSVRPMTSASARRKLRLERYLARFGGEPSPRRVTARQSALFD